MFSTFLYTYWLFVYLPWRNVYSTPLLTFTFSQVLYVGLLLICCFFSFFFGFVFIFFVFSFFFFFFFFFFLLFRAAYVAYGSSQARVKLEWQLPAYTTDTATWNPSSVCDLCQSSQQCRIPDPLSKARVRTTSS